MLSIYTIYRHPEDAPDKFVTRVWLIPSDSGGMVAYGPAWYEDTYEAALAHVPPGLFCLPPSDGDVPCVKESWV